MYDMKVMKSHNRAMLIDAFLRGSLTENEIKEAIQLYLCAMSLEAMK